MKFSLLIICLVGMSAGTDKNYRLNKDVEPLHYTIEVTPYFNNDTAGKAAFTFDGKLEIELKTEKIDVKEITLHIHDLNITSKQILNEILDIVEHKENETTNKHTFKLSDALEANKTYILAFEYTGKLRNDSVGFYRRSYQEGNVTKWLATTKMGPVHARKAFPCFDEPRFKTTFDIIINRPASFQPSMSNSPMKSNTTIGNIVREEFKTTPKMSTYLVAFVVSEFICRENEYKNYSVCARPSAYNQTEYSFNLGQKILAYFDKLFDYPYNTRMEKLSLVAMPNFISGGMENWGLITFREEFLLYEENVTSLKDQQKIAAVIAHEQVHMWFGDLVTFDWWSSLWLSEGFARFFNYFGLAEIEEKWRLEQQFIVDQQQVALRDDSWPFSFPLTPDVNSPEEIFRPFRNAYNKGASVIRMVEHTVGHDTFIAALRNYLKTNELKATVSEDLYAALQKEVGDRINITSFFGSWVTQPGYPVLFVNTSKSRDIVTVTQSRLMEDFKGDLVSDSTLWQIPITFATNKYNSDFSSTNTTAFISTKSTNITMPSGSIEWIVFNVQQSGFYRVNYDDDLWSAINSVLYKSPTDIHVLNRAQIVDDALNLAHFGNRSYENALKTVGYLKNETEYLPWQAAFNHFKPILKYSNDSDTLMSKEYVFGLLDHVYNYLGFQPKPNIDTRLDVYNRVNVLNFACEFGHEQCIKAALDEFNKLKNDSTGYTIPVDLRPVVYCTAIREGSNEDWEFLKNKMKAEIVETERIVIFNAMECTHNDDRRKEYYKLRYGW